MGQAKKTKGERGERIARPWSWEHSIPMEFESKEVSYEVSKRKRRGTPSTRQWSHDSMPKVPTGNFTNHTP